MVRGGKWKAGGGNFGFLILNFGLLEGVNGGKGLRD
jgi:hypothetical protein